LQIPKPDPRSTCRRESIWSARGHAPHNNRILSERMDTDFVYNIPKPNRAVQTARQEQLRLRVGGGKTHTRYHPFMAPERVQKFFAFGIPDADRRIQTTGSQHVAPTPKGDAAHRTPMSRKSVNPTRLLGGGGGAGGAGGGGWRRGGDAGGGPQPRCCIQ